MRQKENENNFTWSTQCVQDLCEGRLSFRSSEFSTSVTPEIYTTSNKSEYFNVNWRLLITLEQELTEQRMFQGTAKKNQYISLLLRKVQKTVFRLPVLKVSFSILHPAEGKKFSRYEIFLDVVEKQHYGILDFISINEFEKLNLSCLTILVEFENMSETLPTFTPLLKSTDSSDVELRIGDKIYPGHKFVLAISSKVFQEKFGSQESIPYLLVEDTELEIFEELLEYMYTGKVQNLKEQAFVLFQAATKYHMCELIGNCIHNLLNNLTLENVVSVLSACERDSRNPQIMNLIRQCTDFIRDNLEGFMNSDFRADLVKMEPLYLADILIKFCSFRIRSKSVEISETLLPRKSEVLTTCQCQMNCETFLNSEIMKDVDIYVAGKKYFAHRFLLAAKSPVFYAMLTHPMKESLSCEIHIDDVESEVFYEVLRFMYTKKIDDSKNIEQKILIAANKYQINDLKFLCECILEKKLDTLNAMDLIDLLIFAEDHDAQKLKEKCLHYVVEKVCFEDGVIYEYKDIFESLAKTHADLVLDLIQKSISVADKYSFSDKPLELPISHYNPEEFNGCLDCMSWLQHH